MRIDVQVLNLPDLEMSHGAEVLASVRQAVIERLEREGFPFGSGHSVWAFYDD